MEKICILENPVQVYAWGSRTAIQGLLGRPVPGERPAAELWMGAHSKASSRVLVDGEWRPLHEIIKSDPESVLGNSVAEKFSKRLPFLFKVLAAEKPLSIQVHPDRNQARAGFERENSLGIPPTAHNRNYKDENHKPEILCAVTNFQGIKGFRKIEDILGLMEKVSAAALSHELGQLRKSPDSQGLSSFFSALMGMEKPKQKRVTTEAVRLAEKYVDEDQAFQWMIRLNREYANDIGILSPLILNLVNLEPGEAIFLPAGELHAYLHGTGMELMANSDNVLRGGLTPKHIDVPELLKVVDFKEVTVEKILPFGNEICERTYPTPAEEFVLSVISVEKGASFTSARERSVEVLICLEGEGVIRDLEKSQDVLLPKGASVIVPAAVSQYGIDGNATLYKATVPV